MKIRYLFVSILIVFCFFSCATTGKKISEPLTYAKIIEISNVSQEDLFVRANMWFVDMFRSADSVIQFSDKSSGVIKGKYISNDIMAGIYYCKITSTITVEVKENRCRISFTDPIYQYVGDALNGKYARPGMSGAVETVDLATKVSTEWNTLALSFEKGINIATSKSNW